MPQSKILKRQTSLKTQSSSYAQPNQVLHIINLPGVFLHAQKHLTSLLESSLLLFPLYFH